MRQPSPGNRPVVKTLCVDIGPRGTTFHITRRARTCTHGHELWCSYRAKPSGKRQWAKVVPYDGYSAEYLKDFDCVKHCDKCTRPFYCDDWTEQLLCKRCDRL